MIGIIVTGHGGFAAGMKKNVKMLAGADTKLAAVDFMEGMTPEDLSEKLTAEIEGYADCSMVLILTDIMGGTPYNCSATLSVANPKVRVIGGINGALLLEACMCNVIGDDPEDPDALVNELIEHARESMDKFVLEVPAQGRYGKRGRDIKYMEQKSIKAVVFDMDGVLIDSEPVYLEHTVQMLREEYPQVTNEAMLPTVGMRSQEYRPFMAKLLQKREDDPDFQKLMDDVNAACKVDYKKIMRPQVPDMLRKLKSMGMKVALASSSSLDNIHQVLGECGIKEYFDSIASGEDFTNGKPSPDIYLFTFEKLNVRPQEALVVEDSTYGVAAGVSSGAFVAALKDERFSFEQGPAQMRIKSLAEVPEIAARGGAA